MLATRAWAAACCAGEALVQPGLRALAQGGARQAGPSTAAVEPRGLSRGLAQVVVAYGRLWLWAGPSRWHAAAGAGTCSGSRPRLVCIEPSEAKGGACMLGGEEFRAV